MCPVSGFSIDEIEPRLFSFNNPYGACKKCDGLGEVDAFDEDILVPDKNLSYKDNAINFWSEKAKSRINPKLKKLFQSKKYEKIIWSKLPKIFQNEVLFGGKDFEGLINIMDSIYDGTSSWWRQWELEKFRNSKICKDEKVNISTFFIVNIKLSKLKE